jgi:hypothetical protein
MINASEIVEVYFSEHLNKHMERISKVDQHRDKAARKYLEDLAIDDCDSIWSSACFFADAEEYTVPSLITKMMLKGIEEANPQGFDGRIVLEVDQLFIELFPLAKINSFNTRMGGTVKQFDNQGNLVAERKVWTLLDFNRIGGNARVSPIAGQFVAEALEKVFPKHEATNKMFL